MPLPEPHILTGAATRPSTGTGIRMGTAELYRAVEALPEVLDSLVVDLEYLGRESYMPLFVVLREGLVLDDALTQRMKSGIREASQRVTCRTRSSRSPQSRARCPARRWSS